MRRLLPLLPALLLAGNAHAQQETILQYFNTSWNEIADRLPEAAEAGYTALWLPPPNKGASGTYSVGYDVYDRFDLGDLDQSGTVRTKYGTKAELLRLVEKAHRFGFRVYFDNIMAHNGGPLDPVAPGTLFPQLRGFVPEDFHLVKRSGQWAKATDSLNYNDEWQVLNRNPFAWDLAQESPNTSFNPTGTAEGQSYAKWSGIRQPGQTWYYLDTDLPMGTNGDGATVYTFANKEPWQDVGYGAGNTGAGNGRFDWNDANSNGQHDTGEQSEPFTDTGLDGGTSTRQTVDWGYGDGIYNMGNPAAEDVNQFLMRAARYVLDQTGADGYRLDAVKHVPSYFFGRQNAPKDQSSAGYCGQIQEQYNLTHGYTDWTNHRDTSFSATLGRNDAVLFGEHLGAPPNPDDYISAGMRIANDDFSNNVGGFGGIGGTLSGYDTPGIFTKGVTTGMMYCLSHDNNYMSGSERPMAHQYMLLRAGLPIVYTDGYNVSGDNFPKPAYIPFLGQYGQNYITGTLKVRRDLLRGDQYGRWSSNTFAAWEFRDRTGLPGLSDADATVLLVMMVRANTSGQSAPAGFTTTLPANTLLRNYSQHGGPFYATVGNDGRIYDTSGNNVVVPSGGYFAFAPVLPEATAAFDGSDSVRPITLQQNGVNCELIDHARKDGKDGDPAYAWNARIPRVTDAANMSFIARADGSAVNMLMKLDGGVDVNSQLTLGPLTGTKRDNPPGGDPAASSTSDLFVGWEQMQFDRRMTQKFASEDVARNIIGSPGAETWQVVIGTAGFTTTNASSAPNTSTDTAQTLIHNPRQGHGINTTLQFSPPPQSAAGDTINIVTRVGYASDAIGSVKLYYTTDGTTYPEGSGNTGRGNTQVANFTKIQNGVPDATGTPEWWRATISSLPVGTVLRYKIGAYKTTAAVRYPTNLDQAGKAARMETIFRITGFNANTVTWSPHNDRGTQSTGLKEGLHIARSRAFLQRDGKSSLGRSWAQTFYLDQARPAGLVRYPAQDLDTIGGSTYGVVVYSDEQTQEVWYSILDSDAGNDSAANGNGTANWARATAVTVPSTGTSGFVKEWRFDYRNIPVSGQATIRVRFKEMSSSADNSLTDTTGWFTTLSRVVNTGSAVQYAIAYPPADGTTVGNGYVAKCVFNKSLGSGISDSQLLNEFSVYLASEVSGTPDGAVLLPRTAYSIVRNETATQDALAFTLPNLYNGDPLWLHHIRVTHVRGDVSLSADRLVKAFPDAQADADGDGLPDYWENIYRLEMNNAFGTNGGSGDPDGDGFTNAEEYAFDISPLNALDVPCIRISTGPAGAHTLTFPVKTTRRYTVQYSDNLQSWLDAAPSFIPAAANADYPWVEPTGVLRRYYRLRAAIP